MINFSLGIYMKVLMVFAVMAMAACSGAKTDTVSDSAVVDSAGVIQVTADTAPVTVDTVKVDSVK
jgi:hypothetical protein